MSSPVSINFERRLEKIRRRMEEEGIDVIVGTRLRTLGYVTGAFIPWRSAVIIPLQGEPEIFTILLDVERVRDDSWIKNVKPWGPAEGMYLESLIADSIKRLGYEKGRIGVEYGQEWILASGHILASEYDNLRKLLPDAEFKNATPLIDELTLYKEPEEIKLLRRASEITDVGQQAVRDSLEVGMTETEVAGIAEYAMRKAGSDWAWTLTGGQEIASGYRTAYALGGCTPATDKIIQPGDNVLVDLHAMYRLYYGDLSHNYIMGRPSEEQRKLSDAFVDISYTVIDEMQPGVKIGEIARKAIRVAEKHGYANNVLFGFGHGIRGIGNESYPLILDMAPWKDMVLEPGMVEVAAVVLNKPGVGGMRLEAPVWIKEDGNEVLPKTPIEPDILET
ncbi:MAG: Xaa-Pro peptidase family protein [Candidatus Jordarchaeales archaeon]